MPQRALLRFDVSPEIGGGHMARCLALGDALAAIGYEVLPCVNADGLAWLDSRWRKVAFTKAALAAELDGPGTYDIAIVDHYGFDTADDHALRRRAARVIVIDDLADRPRDADVLINAAPGIYASPYSDLVGPDTLLLLGTDYAPLRAEFAAARATGQSADTSRCGRLLISFGASDPSDATSLVLDAIGGVRGLDSVTVLLGTSAPHASRVRTAAQASSIATTIRQGVTDMAGLIAQHDIAIGAPGTSALERAVLGLPQIIIQTADNQSFFAKGLTEAGAAIPLGAQTSLRRSSIVEAFMSLTADRTKREAMARAGRALVDGRGADRTAAIIAAAPRDHHGRQLGARRMRRADADLMLAWQRDPETRRHARTTRIPTAAEHAAWIDTKTSDVTAVAELLIRDGRPVAIVRADRREMGYEVSLVVAPDARGQGIGRAALLYLDALLPQATLTAHVLVQNTRSLALFKSAGYGASATRRLIAESTVDAAVTSVRDSA